MNEVPLDIQLATPEDLDSVWNIIDSCSDWLVKAKGLNHWKKYYTRDLVAKKLKAQEVYLAKLKNDPVATVTLDFNPVSYYTKEDMSSFANLEAKTGYVTALAVLPEFQGQGLAARLMSFIEDRARELDGEYLRLDCRASYDDLVRFYQRRNFNTVGVIFDDEDNNAGYLLMEKPISL